MTRNINFKILDNCPVHLFRYQSVSGIASGGVDLDEK